MVQSIGQSAADQNLQYGIRDVWKGNLEQEFKVIRRLVNKYPYIAMDTEFPGVVARPIGEFKSQSDYQYQLVRVNVDQLKIIQLGFTFLDENGNLPASGISTWQFNFRFNLAEDTYACDSIDLLNNSGIQFARHKEEGIEMHEFAELLTTSGIVLNSDVRFISFHSGYDFGYLLKLLTNSLLPETEPEFFELNKIFFPNIYDVKYLMKSCKNLHGGLQEVSDQLELIRVGPQHQAGSDARLTGLAFFKMRNMYFEDHIDDAKYCGQLFGMGAAIQSHYSNGGNYRGGTPQPALPVASNTEINTVSQSDNSIA
ncbi:CCR4-NOT transcription complex subunit 7-like [Watersipora subatra]|uniref:CCR4-NOT transcription complex subunit 7-like n=1 Tax=Watersipora subatra TaxID=2589382 RepID=UPI00355BA18C